MSRTAAIALPIFLAALFAAAFAPAAEAPTRDEYVTTLEKICKPDAAATQEAMKGARSDVRQERFQVAARKFAKAKAIFSGTLKQIKAVPRPSADTKKLAKWFGYLDRQEDYLRQITAALRAGKGIKAQRLTARFIHNGNLANNVVLSFGFNYCSFKFIRYG
jgi:hypothetical protein